MIFKYPLNRHPANGKLFDLSGISASVPSRKEILENLDSTADMDWASWGPTPRIACEEYATAIQLAFPTKGGRAKELLREIRSGETPVLDGFGVLQDLAAESH